MLGAGAAQRLRRALVARARRWAAAVAPDWAWEATSLAAAEAALQAQQHTGPVLLAAPDVPGLDAAVADDARGDLAAGVVLTVGAAHDGRPYVVGLSALDDELLGALGAGTLDDLVALVRARGGELGLLRAERRLSSAADARALALDPLTPEDLAAELAPLTRRLRARPDPR